MTGFREPVVAWRGAADRTARTVRKTPGAIQTSTTDLGLLCGATRSGLMEV